MDIIRTRHSPLPEKNYHVEDELFYQNLVSEPDMYAMKKRKKSVNKYNLYIDKIVIVDNDKTKKKKKYDHKKNQIS